MCLIWVLTTLMEYCSRLVCTMGFHRFTIYSHSRFTSMQDLLWNFQDIEQMLSPPSFLSQMNWSLYSSHSSVLWWFLFETSLVELNKRWAVHHL